MGNVMAKTKNTIIMNALDKCYHLALKGFLGVASAEQLALEYGQEPGTLEEKIDRLIRWQTAKCATAGFVSGLGGILTLPASIPVDLSANWFVQTRMIVAIAVMNGYDVRSDKVKALVYMCLCGNAAKEVFKDIGIKLGKRVAQRALQNISGDVIGKINQMVGFRLFAKLGQEGSLNLGRAVPLVGGLLGGTIDGFACDAVGHAAKEVFYGGDRWSQN
jgi:hypothetical protein